MREITSARLLFLESVAWGVGRQDPHRQFRFMFYRALLLVAYCVPFAFLSVNGDATSGTMLFYGVMIAGFALLCWGALKTNNVAVLYIGNLLSFASSYAVAKLSGMEPIICFLIYGALSRV